MSHGAVGCQKSNMNFGHNTSYGTFTEVDFTWNILAQKLKCRNKTDLFFKHFQDAKMLLNQDLDWTSVHR